MWLEFFEDIQLGKMRLGFVEVVQILPAPAKGLARRMFDARSIHAALFQYIFVLGGKIFAHHADHRTSVK